jgi:5-methylcytosine-specific restriction endonuclease McrA
MPYADPEQARAAARARYQRNRSKVIAQAAAWAAAHPERKREIAREWARKHGRESYRRNRDAGLCGLCGDPVDPSRFHIDHVRPLACGGTHTYGNVQLAHPACNLRKGARLV